MLNKGKEEDEGDNYSQYSHENCSSHNSFDDSFRIRKKPTMNEQNFNLASFR